MRDECFHFFAIFTMSFLILGTAIPSNAMELQHEITDRISINGVLASAFQYQLLTDAPSSFDNTGRASLVFQPEMYFKLTESALLFAKLGFSAGNGLNNATAPWNMSTWAVEHEDDVKDINGSNRDALLEAYYRHELDFDAIGKFKLTGGIIDSACYLDHNAFANTAYTQFMNAALVNSPIGSLPTYDFGGALEWQSGVFSSNFVAMNVARNDDNRNYSFFGVQLGYSPEFSFGKGNYRFILTRTSEDFLDASGNEAEAKFAAWFSIDQAMNDIFGFWMRLGSQDHEAAIDYQHMFSGGVQIAGNLWRRINDTAGVGFTFLNDGNKTIDYSHIFESYYRLGLTNMTSITADLQYLDDRTKNSDHRQGVVFSLRAVVEF